MAKVTKHCHSCGSQDVWRDASATWDVDAQQWELNNVYDALFCEECEETTNTIVDKPYNTEVCDA